MQFCFMRDATVLTLPVTPERYDWSSGTNLETIHISQLGDVSLPGGRSRHSGTVECLLPANAYPFLESGAMADPQHYLDILTAWANEGKPVRYVVSGTEINALVYLESVTWGEQDGTGDVYAKIALREYVDLEAPEVSKSDTHLATGNSGRPAEGLGKTQAYTVVRGDTLSAICRRYYGKSSATYYNALAKYNGIRNPHLIYPGTALRIPSETVLLGGG